MVSQRIACGSTIVSSSYWLESSNSRGYAYILHDAEIEELIGRPFARNRDAFLAVNGDGAAQPSRYVQSTAYSNGALLVYVNSRPTEPMRIDWVLVAGT